MSQREYQTELAKIAYEAYVKEANGRSLITGVILPQWSKLKPEVQRAWVAAVLAVKEVIL